MTEREKIIEELFNLSKDTQYPHSQNITWNVLADWVLADRRRIVAPITQHFTYADDCHYCNKMARSINETLELSGVAEERK